MTLVARPLPIVLLLAALSLAVLAALRMTACAPGETSPKASTSLTPIPVEGSAAAEGGAEEAVEAPAPGQAIRRQAVTVYYPSATSHGLVGEIHEIFLTATPGDRAKQIVADLISGPESDKAVGGISSSARLRQVYVLADGTAYVDFTAEFRQGMIGGSSEELLVIYSVIDSLALNIAEIRRVGILIDGEPIESLTGHVDLRRPLPPNRSLILGTVEIDLASARTVGLPGRG